MEINLFLGILSAIIVVVCACLGALLHRKTEYIKMKEGQLSEKRYSAYAKLYDFFYELLKNRIGSERIWYVKLGWGFG